MRGFISGVVYINNFRAFQVYIIVPILVVVGRSILFYLPNCFISMNGTSYQRMQSDWHKRLAQSEALAKETKMTSAETELFRASRVFRLCTE